jgi:hypothetical protein
MTATAGYLFEGADWDFSSCSVSTMPARRLRDLNWGSISIHGHGGMTPKPFLIIY